MASGVADADMVQTRPAPEGLEDGTLPFLSIAALKHGEAGCACAQEQCATKIHCSDDSVRKCFQILGCWQNCGVQLDICYKFTELETWVEFCVGPLRYVYVHARMS